MNLSINKEFMRGFVSGFFDAEGCFSKNTIRIANTNMVLLDYCEKCLKKWGFKSIIENYNNQCKTIRITTKQIEFFNTFFPAISRKRDKVFGRSLNSSIQVKSIEKLGNMELFDIQTTTENFIANGLVSHNCIVPEKEGKFKIVADIYEFLDKRLKNIVLLDNNILADKKHFIKICRQIQKENLAVDFNQGLDIRLVDEEIAKTLSETRFIKRIRFSFDNISIEPVVRKKMKILAWHIKPSKIMVYVLCGFNTSFEEDMHRVHVIKSLGVDSFVMPYHKNSRLLNEFARWCNIFSFRNVSFKDFLKLRNCSWVLEQQDIKI